MSRPSVRRGPVRDVVAAAVSRLISVVVIPLGLLLTRGSRRRLVGHPEQAVRDACDVVESFDRAQPGGPSGPRRRPRRSGARRR